ncbi:MAG: anaerobic magnesium-protoporphyrin IX monomethyl ester cyclase [Hyphomicrobiaceae bacterium]|jgi:anaerobic magnesium-protoporphyrin IX monomethyl ester cyclase
MPQHADLAGREKIKILYVRPPRHFWPILNESDNFLLPLGYPALAAWVRKTHGVRVEQEILDCCPLNIGWHSLRGELEKRKPDIICIGEKTVYGHEGIRALKLAKSINPDVVTVAGGHLFGALPQWTFDHCDVLDYIIRYEGEKPLEELLNHLLDGAPIEDVSNLCYMHNGSMAETALGDPVVDMTEMPMPAYDLAGVNNYSPFGKLWPRAATVQRGRGCIDTCKFCSWIALEARHVRNADGSVTHNTFYRSKSVEQMLGEIDELYHKYGIRYLFWVDPTWNLNSDWLMEFSEEVIRRKYELGWWAFFRIDQFLKQEKQGVAEAYVRAGLRHVLVGVERGTTPDLSWLKKRGYGDDVTVEAFQLLKKKYPQVFRHGTIITGIRSDTKESIKSLVDLAHRADFDFAAFHPCTPFPGTPLYDEARAGGWIEEEDFSKYDMFYPVMPTEHLSREEVARWTAWCQRQFVLRKPLRYASRMFSPQPNRRALHWWFFWSINRVLARDAWEAARGTHSFRGFSGVNSLWKPRWYES